MAGVVQQHRERMENDETYRKVATTPPSTKHHHNSQERTLFNEQHTNDAIANLTGDDLDHAVKDADIQGRSSMTADEKRQALRDAGYTPGG